MVAQRPPKKQKHPDPLVEFCRSLRGATEDVKWGDDLIFSIGNKMFAGFPILGGDPFGFKVDPLVFTSLVGHNGIEPARYMARHFWVTVTDRKLVPLATLKDLLADAHRIVGAKLPRKTQQALGLV